MHGGVGRGKVPCRIGPLKRGMLPSSRPNGGSFAAAVPSDDLVSFCCNGAVRREAQIQIGNAERSNWQNSSWTERRHRHRNRLAGLSDNIGGSPYKAAVQMN